MGPVRDDVAKLLLTKIIGRLPQETAATATKCSGEESVPPAAAFITSTTAAPPLAPRTCTRSGTPVRARPHTSQNRL
jgi:hypothetical protein